jgi:hypothetical protein
MKLKKVVVCLTRSIGFIFDHTNPFQDNDQEHLEIMEWAVNGQAVALEERFAFSTLVGWLPAYRGMNEAIVHHMLNQMD